MGISVWQLLIVLAIVLVIFGAKRLRHLGGDLGGAVKNFREAVKNPDVDQADKGKLEHDEADMPEASTTTHEASQSKDKEKEKV